MNEDQIARLLTIEEVAALLRKSPAQLRWMIHQGSAPASAKIGGRRMFRETDCVAFVNAAFAAATSTGAK